MLKLSVKNVKTELYWPVLLYETNLFYAVMALIFSNRFVYFEFLQVIIVKNFCKWKQGSNPETMYCWFVSWNPTAVNSINFLSCSLFWPMLKLCCILRQKNINFPPENHHEFKEIKPKLKEINQLNSAEIKLGKISKNAGLREK